MVKMFMGGGNGQWVRTRNKEGAKAFLQERKMESERRQAARTRSRAFWSAARRRIRSIWRRLRG
ncbi:hypothetical protein [Cryobacterium sp. PH29-G1]|uniref:hypothetical protein n=1 Tax=Cryobacterium sp. PH29-G1 TaxID=3046211 RepID=UPI0024B9317B|nr:hypothetical protein [Cryobacterium sp. PH29-G1]MDJ0350772.1 hypothetical protein [Cryobacterium sp. PH29-G1]